MLHLFHKFYSDIDFTVDYSLFLVKGNVKIFVGESEGWKNAEILLIHIYAEWL